MIVVSTRLAFPLLGSGDCIKFDANRLGDSILVIPEPLVGRKFRSILNPIENITMQASIPVRSLLADMPMAVLYNVESA
jgi:hypothetical protein